MTRQKNDDARQIKSEAEAADLFREECGHLVRYVTEREAWIVRVGKQWEFDTSLRVDDMIKNLLASRKDIDPKWKGSLAVVRNVKGFAMRDPALHLSVREIDADPMLLGTKTGVYSFEVHRPISLPKNAYIVNRTSVDPDFGRVCKRWEKFLNQICRNDTELVKFLQRWAGYSLSGSVAEHALLVIYGPGGNGKGVLFNTLASIMGTYHREAAPEAFVEGKGRAHETAMAFIAEARFVTLSETDHGGAWNEATMKRAVAGDPVTTRLLYKNPFTYRPNYKIWIGTNHLPKIKSVGPAMRRRIHLVELDYVPRTPDPDLEAKLRDEHEAILAWMMKGAKEWREQGLNPPRSVMLATDEYFEEQDIMGTWLRERTRRAKGAITSSSALCESYNRFLRSRNMLEVDASYFGRQLRARGYERQLAKAHKDAVRSRCFIGIKLKANT